MGTVTFHGFGYWKDHWPEGYYERLLVQAGGRNRMKVVGLRGKTAATLQVLPSAHVKVLDCNSLILALMDSALLLGRDSHFRLETSDCIGGLSWFDQMSSWGRIRRAFFEVVPRSQMPARTSLCRQCRKWFQYKHGIGPVEVTANKSQLC